MITPFNRAELFVTYDLDRMNQVRYALEEAGLDYQYKTKDLASPTILDGLFGGVDTRARTGTFGITHAARVEYKLYVLRDQLEQAQALLREAGL